MNILFLWEKIMGSCFPGEFWKHLHVLVFFKEKYVCMCVLCFPGD